MVRSVRAELKLQARPVRTFSCKTTPKEFAFSALSSTIRKDVLKCSNRVANGIMPSRFAATALRFVLQPATHEMMSLCMIVASSNRLSCRFDFDRVCRDGLSVAQALTKGAPYSHNGARYCLYTQSRCAGPQSSEYLLSHLVRFLAFLRRCLRKASKAIPSFVTGKPR